MTLQQLEYIVAVDRLRHFAKAAEQCDVTQPTLSAMIQKLEAELGAKLFERSSQQVQPTPVGRKIVAQARVVMAEANLLREIAEEEKQTLAGTFRLGILPTIAPYLLPRFFPRLCKEHPELDLRVVELKTADIKETLAKGEIDAAVIVNYNDLHLFEQTPLYYEQFLAYVSKEDLLFDRSSIRTADLNNE